MAFNGSRFKLVHFTWVPNKRGDGRYAVKLCCLYLGDRKYYGKQYGLDVWMTPDEFDLMVVRKAARGKNIEKQSFLQQYILEAESTSNSIRNFSFPEFEKRFFNKEEKRLNVVDTMRKLAAEKEAISTQNSYKDTANKLVQFRKSVQHYEIDLKFVKSFVRKLEKTCSPSTISIHMRNLRHTVLYAEHQGWIEKDTHPFNKFEYTIKAAADSKKDLPVEKIREIIRWNNPNTNNQRVCVDIWLMCFFCGGANPKDVFLLNSKTINKDIIFQRSKTKEKNSFDIEIPIIPIMDEIVRRNNKNEFLFGVFTSKMTERQIFDKSKKRRKGINKTLKSIFGPGVTLQSARNSFSSQCTRIGVPEIVVSALMGHAKTSVTQGYITVARDQKERTLLDLYNDLVQV